MSVEGDVLSMSSRGRRGEVLYDREGCKFVKRKGSDVLYFAKIKKGQHLVDDKVWWILSR